MECHSPKPQRRGECNYQNNNNNNFLIKKYIQLLKGLKSDLKVVTILKIIRKSSEKKKSSKFKIRAKKSNCQSTFYHRGGSVD